MRWTGISRIVGRRRTRPSAGVGKWLEALLLVVLLVQVARALWVLVTPVGLFGDWRPRQPVLVGADARRALFAGFDPFFRTAGGSGGATVQQVTSLALQLFGTRINESSGLGSAIIAGADGVQQSYAVGDEIMPGVTLKEVAFDHVVIDRGGASETLFIDQSTPVAPSGDGGAATPAAPPPPGPGLPAPPAMGGGASAADVTGSAMFSPRSEGGRTTGIVVSPSGAPAALARTGLKAGDIITQVNGRAVSSPADINALQDQLRPGARLSLMVERGSATVPVAIILEGGK